MTASKKAVTSFKKISLFKNKSIMIRSVIGLIGFFILSTITIDLLYQSKASVEIQAHEKDILGAYTESSQETIKNDLVIFTLPEPDDTELKAAQLRYEEKLRLEEEERLRKEEEERKLQELKRRAHDLQLYLESQNSPMAPYSETIITSAERCGADYKLLTAIAMNESGGGRIPYKKYNPYGYLNGIQYAGWEEAISDITCKIATHYFAKGYNTPETLAGPYGAHNKEEWINNIYYYLNQIP